MAVSPNNPTGSVLSREDLDSLCALRLPVVVDEVFLAYPLEARARPSSALASGHDVLALGGLSKLAGLPQMKVGWIAIGGGDVFAATVLEQLERIADAFLSLSTPSAVATPRWLEASKTTREAIHARARTNLASLRRLVDGTGVTVPRVDAGWYACARLPRTRDDEAWAILLAVEDRVIVQPGYLFDFEDDGWVVLSLLTPERELEEGVRRLVARVDGA